LYVDIAFEFFYNCSKNRNLWAGKIVTVTIGTLFSVVMLSPLDLGDQRSEHFGVGLDEIFEQELSVDLILNVLWKLDEQILVLLGRNGVVFVVRPPVLEVGHHPLAEVDVELGVVVEVLERLEEEAELLVLLEIAEEFSDLSYHFIQVLHNVGSDGDTE